MEEKRPLLLLVHGWALGPGLWRPLRHHLPGWRTHSLNLGFFGELDTTLPQEPWIGLGHSLGYLWLLSRLADPAIARYSQGLVSIGGFSCFHRQQDFPHGVPPRLLERMRTRLQEDPLQVISDFAARSGVHPPLPAAGLQPHLQHLDQGLALLQEHDARSLQKDWATRCLALASRDDPIVSPDMSRECFPDTILRWSDTGGHLLPLTRPAWCAGMLTPFLTAREERDVR
ncbi:MAG: alpha/beta hydrolase [Magnetococcales bacterium]|nr:alpha/beta hydrolase [Magnetococcales bacterium]